MVTAMEEVPRKSAQTAMRVYRWGLGEAASPLIGVHCACLVGVKGSGLMICAQASLVEGIRLLLFHKIRDGELRSTVRGKAKSPVACSKIMIAYLKNEVCQKPRSRS